MNERALVILDERVDARSMLAAVDTLRRWPRLALDTESDSFHRYFERVCLIQISTPEEDLIFDPLAHGMPQQLRDVLTASDRLWVLHGGDYDVLSLRRDFDLAMGKLFDTNIAARFLGAQQLGLQAVLQNEMGVKITKHEQRSDWGRRPLTASQIGYARQDTEHLLALAEVLREKLREKGRLSWVEEECELLRVRIPVVKEFDPDAWIKISGARVLPELGQRALRAGYLWRDAAARKKNVAPFRVIGNETLLAIAQRVVKEGVKILNDLHHQRGVARGLDAGALAEAIRRGIGEKQPIFPKRGEDRRPPPMDLAQRARLDRLREARKQWSEALRLEAGLVIPTALLESLARDPPCDLEGLARVGGITSWRIEAIGAPLLKVLDEKS